GVEVGAGRFSHLSRLLRGILAEAGNTVADIDASAGTLTDVLVDRRGVRLVPPLPDDLSTTLTTLRERVARAQAALGGLPDDAPDDAAARALRARQAATALMDDLDILGRPTENQVVWVEGNERFP